MLGLTETSILVLAVVGMVFFGHDKIPKFARSLGKARSEFENGKTEEENE